MLYLCLKTVRYLAYQMCCICYLYIVKLSWGQCVPAASLLKGLLHLTHCSIIFCTVFHTFLGGCCEEAAMNDIISAGHQGRERHRMQKWKVYSSHPGDRIGCWKALSLNKGYIGKKMWKVSNLSLYFLYSFMATK